MMFFFGLCLSSWGNFNVFMFENVYVKLVFSNWTCMQ